MAKRRVYGPLGANFDELLLSELKDPEFASLFMAEVIGDKDLDPKYLRSALHKVVTANGFATIAERSGIGRTALYKMLAEDGNPSFTNVIIIAEACGLTLNFVAHQKVKHRAESPRKRKFARRTKVAAK